VEFVDVVASDIYEYFASSVHNLQECDELPYHFRIWRGDSPL